MTGCNKNTKMVRLLIFSNLITMLILFIYTRQDRIVLTEVSDVVKTVAHVEVHNDNLELIYKDEINDIAYYRYIGKNKLAKENDILRTCYGDSVKIVYADIYGFKVKSDISVIQPGMSGTALEDVDGNTVGYVSTILEDNVVYCIWK